MMPGARHEPLAQPSTGNRTRGVAPAKTAAARKSPAELARREATGESTTPALAAKRRARSGPTDRLTGIARRPRRHDRSARGGTDSPPAPGHRAGPASSDDQP